MGLKILDKDWQATNYDCKLSIKSPFTVSNGCLFRINGLFSWINGFEQIKFSKQNSSCQSFTFPQKNSFFFRKTLILFPIPALYSIHWFQFFTICRMQKKSSHQSISKAPAGG